MRNKLPFLLLCAAYQLAACTGIRLTAEDGSSVNGRTVEFGSVIEMHAAVIPRKYLFVGETPHGDGLTYRAKYATMGIYCFDKQVLMDGMNEKGLSAGTFYFPGYASYTPLTEENQVQALSPLDFPNWILTQFATVDEVKAALPSVVIVPTVFSSWGKMPPPFHYAVYDKSGKSIVIEPMGDDLIVYDNAIGAITNSPTFDWQMTNLRNFINLTPFNVKPISLEGIELAPFGQGSGMVGLPGDFTPPSRFVRAVIFSATAIPSKNAQEAVNQAFHILNQFDIPVGIARSKENGILHTDYTQLTSVKDPQSLRYYFKSYEDQLIKYIDLKKFNLKAKEIKSIGTKGEQTALDISSSLHAQEEAF